MNTVLSGGDCELLDATGSVIGYAKCTVKSAESDSKQVVLSQTGAIEIHVFDVVYAGADFSDHTKAIRALAQEAENKFYEYEFSEVYPISIDSQHCVFNSSRSSTKLVPRDRFNEVVGHHRVVDWSSIKAGGCIGGSKGNAFEALCRELLLQKDHRGYYCNFSFFPPGPDGGRDGKYELCEKPFPTVKSMVICILQCKYSENVKTDIRESEINDELVKVLQYHPRHFVLATNRNIKPSFEKWFKEVDSPFTKTLVQREVLEELIKSNPALWSKYFGR